MKRLGTEENSAAVAVEIGKASFPAPFSSGLEYSAPARGTWNIVHTGMLIPEAHQIFVCAQGCLRGVVLTAAEMGAQDRFSTIAVRENNVLDGDMESLILDGVADILSKLPKAPRAVLLYTSCIHHFMGCDLPYVFRTLRERFPAVDFTDCYMDPVMRKSGLNPDQKMRRQLYSLLKSCEKDPKAVSVVGNDFALDKESELYRLMADGGYRVQQIGDCRTYDEYQRMAQSSFCVTTNPAANAAGKYLEDVHGQKHLYLPFSFDADEITANLETLARRLQLPLPDLSVQCKQAEEALTAAKEVIGDTAVAIDYTAFSRPLGLARLFLSRGFRVERVYADGFTKEETGDFAYLKENHPRLLLFPTVHTGMRTVERQTGEPTLAIGQKAAYFCGTDRFVNLVEDGGLYGFSGIVRLCELMIDAYRVPKDTRGLIQIKGMGCGCCL